MHMRSYPLGNIVDQLNSERFYFKTNFNISKKFDVLVLVTIATSSYFYSIFELVLINGGKPLSE
jgi:hypothetical protein